MVELTELSETLGKLLFEKNLVLTTAESCTGGGIASAITDIAGSSSWFDRAFITYSNEAKIEMLGVDSETLDRNGAVSEEIVKQMASGAVKHSHAHIAMSVSGIAGPGGGSEEKPVGTVWFGWQLEDGRSIQKMKVFSGNRAEVRKKACRYAISSLIEMMDG